MLSEQKINVRTYTSDFERGLMNGLDKMFGSKYGNSGTHIGCFFHLKQAWRKYLIETVKMPSPEVVKDAMKIGCLDILCIIPRDEVAKYGIPYLRWTLEKDQLDNVKQGWNVFWQYFEKQWMPILNDWNICGEDGWYISMVNHTNNGIESYNNTINSLFKKKPSLIKFVQVLEEESRNQAFKWIGIATGNLADPSKAQKDSTIPSIPDMYTKFKEKLIRKQRDAKKEPKEAGLNRYLALIN